ncbi:aspartyl protease [Martiniozyma asiatica (nom. inval.)]|nr:aspartyl protease [Martiniozyma asiatica]
MLRQLVLFSLFQLICEAIVIPDTQRAGYFAIEAKKYRGSSLKDAHPGAKPALVVREDSNGNYLSVGLSNEQTFYLTNLEIGSTSQKVGVLVDTGSSDLWVVANNNTYCESGTTGSLRKGRALSDIFDKSEGDKNADVDVVNNNSSSLFQSKASSSNMIDCSVYGTFDESQSDTFSSNGTSFSITYADGTFANGIWGYDHVTIGGTQLNGLSFAVCDDTDNNMGVLGIGLAGLETTFSGSTSSNSYKYENLPMRLKSLGITDSVSYSVHLNDTTSDDATILFGAVDHKRYTGDLVTVPIINSLQNKGYSSPIQLEVTLNSVTFADSSNSSEVLLASGAAAALLDTGTTLTYIPSTLLTQIISSLNVQYSSSVGYYVMKCTEGQDLSLIFDFQGQKINVPFESFLVSLVTTSGSTSSYCMVGLQSSGDSGFTLGDSFLRYAYMVADLDNLEISLAQAAHNVDGNDIEVISSSVPSAVSASSSNTYGASATILNVSSGAVMSVVSNDSATKTNTATAKGTTATKGTSTSSGSATGTVSSISTKSANGVGRTSCGVGLSLAVFIAAFI